MFHALRKHITPASVLALVALVFAVTGGAYAAGGSGNGSGARNGDSGSHGSYYTASVAKAKKQGKSTPTGKPGPRGPAGPAGPAGLQGPAAAAGAKGENGAAGGQGPQGTQGPQGVAGATGATGPAGQTGFTETLPAEKTEKGDWSLTQIASSETLVTTGVSFGIPLAEAEAPVPHLVKANHMELKVGKVGNTFVVEEVTPTNCLGSAADPKANPGTLCVYVHLEHGLESDSSTPGPAICAPGGGSASGVFLGCQQTESGTAPMSKWGVDPSGFSLVAFIAAGLAELEGTWAVTAE